MKTFVQILAVLSVVATATPTRAHTMHHQLPPHARDFEASAPRVLSKEVAPGFALGAGDDDSHQTATGGPSGSLF